MTSSQDSRATAQNRQPSYFRSKMQRKHSPSGPPLHRRAWEAECSQTKFTSPSPHALRRSTNKSSQSPNHPPHPYMLPVRDPWGSYGRTELPNRARAPMLQQPATVVTQNKFCANQAPSTCQAKHPHPATKPQTWPNDPAPYRRSWLRAAGCGSNAPASRKK